jgi:hypothetical protein
MAPDLDLDLESRTPSRITPTGSMQETEVK